MTTNICGKDFISTIGEASPMFAPSTKTKVSQCSALLKALLSGPIDTLTARQSLGICHIAGRIRDLRRQGFCIETRKTDVTDSEGRRHGVALYVLTEGISHASR